MNWKNVKIFFIIILAAVNIYLLASYVTVRKESTVIDDATLNDIVTLMSENGIAVDKANVPREKMHASIVKSDFDSGYYERVASALSDCEKESVNILPDNTLRIIMSNGDQSWLDRKFGFIFVSNDLTQLTSDDFISSISTDSYDGYSESSLKRKEKDTVSAFLYPEDICKDAKAFSFDIEAVFQKGNNKIVVCSQKIGEFSLSGHTVYVELTDNTVSRAAGTWFFPQNSDNYSYDLYDQLSVLFKEIELAKTVNSGNDVGENASYKISGIDFTYCIYWNTNQDGLFFIPAWKITTDTDEVRLYNAVSCELYE